MKKNLSRKTVGEVDEVGQKTWIVKEQNYIVTRAGQGLECGSQHNIGYPGGDSEPIERQISIGIEKYPVPEHQDLAASDLLGSCEHQL